MPEIDIYLSFGHPVPYKTMMGLAASWLDGKPKNQSERNLGYLVVTFGFRNMRIESSFLKRLGGDLRTLVDQMQDKISRIIRVINIQDGNLSTTGTSGFDVQIAVSHDPGKATFGHA